MACYDEENAAWPCILMDSVGDTYSATYTSLDDYDYVIFSDGTFQSVHKIGDLVEAGETVGSVADVPMAATISGVLRGLLADGVSVKRGMKSGDVDPRGDASYCDFVSDKALAVAGGVLEAILHFEAANHGK